MQQTVGRWIVAICVVATILVVGLWFGWAGHAESIAQKLAGSKVPVDAASWGDAFGAYNALIGALGFVALLTTLLLQGGALRQQQIEQHRQRFESSFFQLLQLMRELREHVQFEYPVPDGKAGSVEGLPAIRLTAESLSLHLGRMPLEADNLGTVIGEIYETRVLATKQNELGPYFRVIYNMLDRLGDDRSLSEQEKYAYSRLLRGQLSDAEVILMGANGLSSVSKDFRDLITTFTMLKYLPKGPSRELFELCYPPGAFVRPAALSRTQRGA